HSCLGRPIRRLRKIRRLGRKKHVWPQIHGHRPLDLSDRSIGDGSRGVAQGAGAGPCRRSAEGGRRPLNWESRTGGAAAILGIPGPAAKAGWSRARHEAWRAGAIDVGDVPPPLRPARPERPRLLPPRMMPRRRNLGSLAGRIALLHALAHIELNAIDLGWD